MTRSADLLTGLRLVVALPLAVSFAQPEFLDARVGAVLLAAAIGSEYLDGKVARRLGTASPRGQLFDHGTDCLFVTACLTGAAAAGQVPLVLPVLVAVAFGQYVFDSYWVHRQKRLRMSTLGRWNGIGYFVPLVGLAAARLDAFSAIAALLVPAARATAYVLVASTLASIVDRATAARRAREE